MSGPLPWWRGRQAAGWTMSGKAASWKYWRRSSTTGYSRFSGLNRAQGYSPQVINSWPVEFESGGYIGAQSQLTPDNIDRFYNVVALIAKDLREKPVSADELQRVVEPLRQLIARASSGNSFWMGQLEGASYNPQKFVALQSLLPDYTVITPEEVQALAIKYLNDETKWKLAVLPESNRLAANDNEPAIQPADTAASN